MDLGFIGLGHLGKAVAGRLLDRGHSLTVWNRTAAKAEDLPAESAATPAQVANTAEIILMCLFDSQAVLSVLSQEDGLLAADLSGKIIVDLTTNHFKDVNVFYELCQKAGGVYMEAPVLGSVIPASQGALTVLVSGEKTVYEKVKPVLEDIGKHLFYFEAPALATKMKLINNLVLASFMTALAEALSLGESVGFSKQELIEVLSKGAGNSVVLNAKKSKLLAEDFAAHFSNALLHKDLHCVQDLAYDHKAPLFTGMVAKELYARTLDEGMAQEDFAGIYKLFK